MEERIESTGASGDWVWKDVRRLNVCHPAFLDPDSSIPMKPQDDLGSFSLFSHMSSGWLFLGLCPVCSLTPDPVTFRTPLLPPSTSQLVPQSSAQDVSLTWFDESLLHITSCRLFVLFLQTLDNSQGYLGIFCLICDIWKRRYSIPRTIQNSCYKAETWFWHNSSSDMFSDSYWSSSMAFPRKFQRIIIKTSLSDARCV